MSEASVIADVLKNKSIPVQRVEINDDDEVFDDLIYIKDNVYIRVSNNIGRGVLRACVIIERKCGAVRAYPERYRIDPLLEDVWAAINEAV